MRRLYFSLIELMIVLGILFLISGVVGIGVTRAWQEQKFSSEVNQVVNKLRLAQNLMLILRSDVEVVITKNNEAQYVAGLKFGSPMPNQWGKELQRFTAPFTQVQTITWNQQPIQDLLLRFISGGSMMSKGVLHLIARNGQERFIPLLGYPSPINSSTTLPPMQSLLDQEKSFDDQLTQRTREEIHVEE